MERILVATDGSETAGRAAEMALEEGETHGARVIAVHVLDTSDYASPKRGGWQSFYEEIRGKGKEVAQEVCDLADERGLDAECVLLEGEASEEITGFAEETGVDHIFMGTVGRSGLREVLLGSTAERVIRSAHCPVTVVPGH